MKNAYHINVSECSVCISFVCKAPGKCLALLPSQAGFPNPAEGRHFNGPLAFLDICFDTHV